MVKVIVTNPPTLPDLLLKTNSIYSALCLYRWVFIKRLCPFALKTDKEPSIEAVGIVNNSITFDPFWSGCKFRFTSQGILN